MRMIFLAVAFLAACSEAVSSDDALAPPEPIHVDASGAAALTAQPGLTILDVRTPEEHAAGAIADSVNVDWKRDDFAEALAALDRDAPILLHCESGRRSTAALTVLAEQGFTNVAHLDGGLAAWRAAGLPVVTP